MTHGHRDTQRRTEIGGTHRLGLRVGETKTQSHIVTQRVGSPRERETGTWGDMRRDSGGHGVVVVQPTHHSVLLDQH